jgi:general L-amino acid transport system permease protein
MTIASDRPPAPDKVPFYNDPKIRGYLYQVVLLAFVAFLAYEFVMNARENLQAQRIATGFGFLDNTAGFGISQTLVPYSEASSYGRVFLVGLLNTLIIAFIGVIFATLLGFIVGIARLSKNKLVAALASTYVELIRNLPLLFQILFWYLAVLGALPGPRQSISLFDEVFLNNRGIIMPRPVFAEGSWIILAALAAGLAGWLFLRSWARKRQAATGEQFPIGWSALGLIVVLPLLVTFIGGFVTFDEPALRGFNFQGGMRIIPEFVALLLALVTYTAGFIAEIVRAGILAVSHGQTEAAHSLGLKNGPTLRLVVIPQAMRVIIPPLTSQYLNLTKNSSLAVGIGYPDLVAVFAGTTLNQTGQAIEIIAMTMACYLTISLITSGFMNWYNARTRLVER